MSFLVKLAVFVLFYAIFHAYVLMPYIGGGVCTSKARMDGQTVIITGANTGIGRETAIDLARRGARVIMACRDLTKAEVAARDVVEKTGSKSVVVKRLDLASLKSVREFAKDVNMNEPRLDVLINNAGVMGLPVLVKTEDGFETQMGVNHLGHFLLTNLLLDLLKQSAPSRVVVVSSMAHRLYTRTPFNFENMNGEIFYDSFDAYGQSKLGGYFGLTGDESCWISANILFTRELARRLKGTGVTANSLHPGAINTELGRHLPSWLQSILKPIIPYFVKTPVQGAQTNIHLAVSEEVEGITGLYFADCKVRTPAESALDDEAAKRLWDESSKLVGLNSH